MSGPSTHEWENLIRQAKAGDRDAFAQLITICSDDIESLVREKLWSTLRPKVDSQDVVQSTIREALAGVESFEDLGQASFKAWILRIADRRLSALSDRFLAQMRDIGRESPLHVDTPGTRVCRDGSPVTSAGPATRLGNQEEQRIVRECIDRLEEPYRTVLLSDLDGLTSNEIGRKLDKPATTVRTLRVRARARLAPLLREKLPSWPPHATGNSNRPTDSLPD